MGSRFFPSTRSSKITELQARLTELGTDNGGEVAVRRNSEMVKQTKDKNEKASARVTAKARSRQSTDLMRSKLGMNPDFLELQEMDPFSDPYVLVPVEDPRDDNVRRLCWRL
jgi:hypothetical protein